MDLHFPAIPRILSLPIFSVHVPQSRPKIKDLATAGILGRGPRRVGRQREGKKCQERVCYGMDCGPQKLHVGVLTLVPQKVSVISSGVF